jgi:hypothetical protein
MTLRRLDEGAAQGLSATRGSALRMGKGTGRQEPTHDAAPAPAIVVQH